jgi:hypothetical protein
LALAGSYAELITAAAMEPNQSSQAVSIERSSDAQRPSYIRKGAYQKPENGEGRRQPGPEPSLVGSSDAEVAGIRHGSNPFLININGVAKKIADRLECSDA